MFPAQVVYKVQMIPPKAQADLYSLGLWLEMIIYVYLTSQMQLGQDGTDPMVRAD